MYMHTYTILYVHIHTLANVSQRHSHTVALKAKPSSKFGKVLPFGSK